MTSILLVNSEKKWIEDIGRCLFDNGYNTFYAKNTSEALDDLGKSAIDIVIADIMAPKMTGLTLLSVVNQHYPKIPVILIADASSVDEAKAAVEEDAFDYLVKPVADTALLKSVHMALWHQRVFSNDSETAPRQNVEVPARVASDEDLFNAISSTFHTIGRILELKDPLSAGHERKVANLALSIAKKLKLEQHRQDCIYFASFLHDIGKLLIPSEILSKPGKLTPSEYVMVKDHVSRGCALIESIKLPWPILDVVYQHHERVDGSGYPEGLSGDSIMLEARILAVADVIEAMTSYRPYRPRFDIRVALREISENRGILYDETVCDAVNSLFREDNFQIEDAPSGQRLVVYK